MTWEGFLLRTRPNRETGCWQWTGAKKRRGYGGLRWQGRDHVAHRVAYEQLRGPIPEGMQLDHLCRNPGCVNPFHLEPVTCRQNILRGVGPTAQNARKRVCRNGHPLDEQNTYMRPDGKGRECRICRRVASREYAQRQVAA